MLLNTLDWVKAMVADYEDVVIIIKVFKNGIKQCIDKNIIWET